MDFATLELRSSPNQYLVCPEGFCQKAQPGRVAPTYDVDAPSLQSTWSGALADEPRLTILEERADRRQIEYVQKSAVLRFPDFITVEFISLDEGRSSLAVYSRSKYGYSDLGVNRKRVERWLSLLDNALR